MNVNLLIDAIVRQTTVLLAQLATAAGARATLAHTANQVFMDLVGELKSQGLSNKVISDMFGMTLRTYHHRVARLSESTTERGRSLWEALFDFIRERTTVSRSDVLVRFARDDETKVRGVLQDLVDSGLVFRTGRGDDTIFRLAGEDERTLAFGKYAADQLENFVWISVYRNGPLSRSEILEQVPATDDALDSALRKLESDGRIQRSGSAGAPLFESVKCVIPLGSAMGWEAAVFDHYQAMVIAICAKLNSGTRRSIPGEAIGGSTYGLEVWDGHPHREEVLGLLQAGRDRAVALREKVAAHNAANPVGENPMRVVSYLGQAVIGNDSEEE